MTHFDLPAKEARINECEEIMLADGFWDDRKGAQIHIDELNQLRTLVETFAHLHKRFSSILESLDLLKEEFDAEFFAMLEQETQEAVAELDQYEILVLLSHDYDRKNAILEIHPGAGGTESQDWAEMLLRMYTRWAEKHGFKVETIDYLAGDEAGVKSVTIRISGEYAYGYLKSEKGVHRLVRISPFDSSGRRHTSFASVDLMPEFDDNIKIELNPQDLVIETHRSSGAGGQHVNKTDSAIRITHTPSGTVVTSQSQRSQLQNKEQALGVLKSKLYQLEIEKQEQKLADIKGEQKLIEWGSQIRSYVFHPYSMVKDHRTLQETGNVDAVMDGALDPFIYAYLKQTVR